MDIYKTSTVNMVLISVITDLQIIYKLYVGGFFFFLSKFLLITKRKILHFYISFLQKTVKQKFVGVYYGKNKNKKTTKKNCLFVVMLCFVVCRIFKNGAFFVLKLIKTLVFRFFFCINQLDNIKLSRLIDIFCCWCFLCFLCFFFFSVLSSI